MFAFCLSILVVYFVVCMFLRRYESNKFIDESKMARFLLRNRTVKLYFFLV